MEVSLFFEFIQVAVGNRKSLSGSVTDADWLRLFEFCKKQALIGVGFSAVEKLHAKGVVCPAGLRMRWMALALQIEKRNGLLNQQCSQLARKYEHDGLETCILKGQGNCLNYPEELRNRRQCGDIDVWATPINVRQQEQLETTICPQADDGGERELSQITRELKEIGPQADDGGEQQLFTHCLLIAVFIKLRKFFAHCLLIAVFIKLRKFFTHCQLKEVFIKLKQVSQIKRELKEICPQADGGIAIAVQTGKEEVEYVEYHGRKAVREYVRMQHRIDGYFEKPIVRYHHIEAPKMDGTEVEVHFRPCYAHSPLRNWRMQRWFENHADVCTKNKTHMGFAVPTASVNVVYQMCHLFSHYFDEGLGLRQLMDYYFALRVWHNDAMECKDLKSQGMWSEGLGTAVMSKEEVMAVIRSFGMGKFAGAVMWVVKEVFGGGNENDNENEKGNHNENEKCPRRTRRGTDGCPQADSLGERELKRINRELKEMGPQADDGGERKLKQINRELKENNFAPWMLCEPNEKEGKKLLEEIMKGGNFGQYDTRDAALKNGGMMKHGLWKLKRVMRLVRSYPEEALWEPVFRVWHLGWRKVNG